MSSVGKIAGELAISGVKRGFEGGFADVAKNLTAVQLEKLLNVISRELSKRVSRRRKQKSRRRSNRSSKRKR
ncbi:hypothetical protein COB52_00400 [Candidatus Kaiserbacteria bacterium]|nr:MAG: hypothetical protein COB52_00400 [Candidatus Kaiserbacteria bacterium]